mmetsp:Transcript_12631/g.12266  ORF Transcript_12631/g.12266 Transcript_12631/m.12266 type:complete len:97 (-) Transcript_12631:173-463(-)
MAFRQSVKRMAVERNDINKSLSKVWKRHYDIEGQVTQHLSPFEQNIVSPMFKDAGSKIFAKLKEAMIEAGPGLGVGIAAYYWAEYEYKRQAFIHRD